MKDLVLALIRYGAIVLAAWYVLLGTFIGWFVLSLWDRLKPFRVRGYLAILCVFLVVAPFRVWREQSIENDRLQAALSNAVSERDSLAVVLASLRSAPPASLELPDKYRAARARVAFFIRQADTLMTNNARMYTMRPEEVAEWTKRVRDYLNTSGLDPSYALAFDGAVDPGDENTYSGGVSIALRNRRSALQRSLEQMRRP